MKLIELSVTDFINELDSASPAPGGGSVSALAGILGVSLARMVGHLTIPKKAFLKLEEEEQTNFKQAIERLQVLKDALLPLVDKDTEAFNHIMSAYKLPKETEDEKSTRLSKIQDATIGAIKVPMEVAHLSIEALKLLQIVEEFGNKNCLSDIGVGALQIGSAAQGALMNVKINLASLTDESMKKAYLVEANELFQKANIYVNYIVNKIYEKL